MTASNRQSAAELLTERMRAAHLTQRDVAERTGLSQSLISRILKGKSGKLRPSTEQKLLGFLNAGRDGLVHPSYRDTGIESVGEATELKRSASELQAGLGTRRGPGNIVGRSPALTRVLENVEKVADSRSTVLIRGESGTGKELIARALHFNSYRAERAFVTVNCGAIPEELLESELFGHVKGAFSNAVSHREGRVLLADGGTLFLDEIGDMSSNLQVKLMRVIEDRTFELVGSSRTVSVDVRVVAATHVDLEEAVRQGSFRADLYYRLNVIPIEVPPLRQRLEDVPLLVQYFLDMAAGGRSQGITGIHPAALEALCMYSWPGNVRELQNLVERLVIFKGEGEIQLEDLPETLTSSVVSQAPGVSGIPDSGLEFKEVVERFETDLIRQALEKAQWNKHRAAELLGIGRTTLLEKVKRRGILEPGAEPTARSSGRVAERDDGTPH